MDDRIERALIAGARRYAPPLAPPGWQRPGDYREPLADLARGLAGYGLLAVLVQSPAGQSAIETPVWVDALQSLYLSLCQGLFPSYTTIQAYYADGDEPPIVLLPGACIPVIMALSGYVLPYVAARHGANPPDRELTALLDAALDWLEASDLPDAEVQTLRSAAAERTRALLESRATVRALAPAAPDAPIPARTRSAPPSLPEARPASSTPPPMTLPESAPPAARPAPASLPEAGPPPPPLPVVFERPARPMRRRPPLPD